jgi:hypothetical protein
MSARTTIQAGSTPVCIRVVSSLAEGADRVLLRAMPQGSQWEAILPLPPADYCADFDSEASKQEFTDLLTKAAVRGVVPSAASRVDAYDAAGKAVVDRSDVMVFMWNGRPARGHGGTAEIYEYARQRKKAIFWIRIDGGRAELALEPQAGLLPPPALQQLGHYDHLQAASLAKCPPLMDQLNEAGMGEAKALSDHFSCYFARADALAGQFQRRWFWLTRLLYAFAALAVIIVAAQILYEPRHDRYAWYEFVTLLCVTALLLLAHFSKWHDTWISARYLAEQIRSLTFLALAGISVADYATPSARRPDPTDKAIWTDRAIKEISWSQPRYVPQDVDAARKILDEQWIIDQLRYHNKTRCKYEGRSRRFTWIAISLFSLSAMAALLHSLGIGQPHSLWAFLSIVIPSVGAALSGYGAQRDYARHAERSRVFALTLEEAHQQLAETASLRDIQQVALNVARLMRGETGDWYSIVRIQEIEPP